MVCAFSLELRNDFHEVIFYIFYSSLKNSYAAMLLFSPPSLLIDYVMIIPMFYCYSCHSYATIFLYHCLQSICIHIHLNITYIGNLYMYMFSYIYIFLSSALNVR